jgi:peptide/nickel transport system substrate-binding protein
LLLKNDDYFIKGVPYLESMYVRYIPERATMVASLEVGEIQASHVSIAKTDAERLMQNPNMEVYSPFYDSCWHLDFNLTVPPFDDVRVRKAVAHAIDGEDLNERLYLGRGRPMTTPFLTIPEWVPSTDPEGQMPEYNPAKAEELLELAGYTEDPDGVRLRCNFWSVALLDVPDQTELLKQYLHDVGIEVDVQMLDVTTWKDKVIIRRDFDGFTIAGGSTGWDPDGMKLFVGTGGPRNTNLYSNARVDELFELGASVAEPEERKPYYDEIQKILVEDMPRVAYIHYIKFFAQRSDYHGFFWEPEAGKLQANKQVHLAWWEGGDPTPEPPTPPPEFPDLEAVVEYLGDVAGDLDSAVSSLTGTIGDLEDTITNLQGQLAMATNLVYIAVVISVLAVVTVIVIAFKRK